MNIQHFFDKETATFTYVVSDEATKKCAIIDSVLNYDAFSGRTSTTAADAVMAYVQSQGLTVDWLLETPGTNITISRYTLTVLLTTLLFNQLIYMLTIFSLIQQFMIFILRRLVSPLLEYIDINKSPLTRATQVFL